eukprot:TRINITY_DN8228_c0_g1_i1.p1 TRINITY_DN8228_c0_g1~~TRINITY_DN8228_c0_g1_i1.p1  ORF type:complete len:263 (-),score=57.02 TRINITY_DN8228_c0_g1_i1:45-833(-)
MNSPEEVERECALDHLLLTEGHASEGAQRAFDVIRDTVVEELTMLLDLHCALFPNTQSQVFRYAVARQPSVARFSMWTSDKVFQGSVQEMISSVHRDLWETLLGVVNWRSAHVAYPWYVWVERALKRQAKISSSIRGYREEAENLLFRIFLFADTLEFLQFHVASDPESLGRPQYTRMVYHLSYLVRVLWQQSPPWSFPEHHEAWCSFTHLMGRGLHLLLDPAAPLHPQCCTALIPELLAHTRWTISRLYIAESLHECAVIR